MRNEQIARTDNDIRSQTRDILRNIQETHQTGYGIAVTEKLIRFGLKQKGLKVVSSPVCASVFQGRELGETPLDCLLVEDSLLLVFTALFENNQFNISRGLSFMNTLNIPWGIAVNFGKQAVQFNGLYNQTIRGTALPSVAPSTSPIRGT